jgi:hypothetical protein
MNRKAMATTQVAAGVVGAMVLVSGAAWGLFSSEESKGPKVPENLTVESIKQKIVEDSGAAMRTVRETMENEELTDEERRAARRNIGRAWMELMDERITEYENAGTEEEKNAVLDRQIDEFIENMKKMRESREERRKQRETERKENGQEDMTDAERAERRQERMKQRMGATKGERKARSESRSAESMARRANYFKSMRQRAEQRGIEMPRYGGRGGRSGDRSSGRGGDRGGRSGR